MAKTTQKPAKNPVFACKECGDTFGKWAGKCGSCGAWDSLVEVKDAPSQVSASARGLSGLGALGQPGVGAVALKDIPEQIENRIPTGITEFNRVLGGGVVPGSLVLI